MSAFALANAMSWAGQEKAKSSNDRALCSDLRHRIQHVTEYRDSLIEKRDRKAAQIPLRPHEERMWENKIATAEATIASLEQELAEVNQDGQSSWTRK